MLGFIGHLLDTIRRLPHKILILWRPQGDSNPCYRREKGEEPVQRAVILDAGPIAFSTTKRNATPRAIYVSLTEACGAPSRSCCTTFDRGETLGSQFKCTRSGRHERRETVPRSCGALAGDVDLLLPGAQLTR